MNQPITITLTANEGVLIRQGNHRLLVDGIHRGGGGFSPVPSDLLEEMCQGVPPFDNIDLVLYTHCHPDHFHPGDTARYLENNQVKGLFLPDEPLAHRSDLMEAAARSGCALRWLSSPMGKVRLFSPLPGVHIGACRLPHAGGKDFEGVANYCLLISLEGFNIFIPADADYLPEEFSRILAGTRVDLAMVNPLYVNKPEGRASIAAVAPRSLVVYHMPFEGMDQLGFRRAIQRNLVRHHDTLPPTSLLWNPRQTLAFAPLPQGNETL